MNRTPPTLVITFDLELAWGAFDRFYCDEYLLQARWTHDYGVPTILDALSRNNLSATWAVVGMLAERVFTPPSDLTEVSYSHFPHPWFRFVPPNSSESESPEWFAASLLRRIQETEPKQEIGFHSLSHVIFGDPGTPSKRAKEEFHDCMWIGKQLGFVAESFVFPRNSIGHLDLLYAAGFKCFRSPDDLPYSFGKNKVVHKVIAVLSDFLAVSPKVVSPSIRNAMVAIPGSLMIRHAKGWRSLIPDRCRLQRLRAGLKQVCLKGGIFHVWLHPEDLYFGRPRLERVLSEFLDDARSHIEQGTLRCSTMREIANEYLTKTMYLSSNG
jgi:hypothetical protein